MANPRNVRNFWCEVQVDGKTTPIAFGPQNKDGGLALTIKMRDNGESVTVATVRGIVHSITGELILTAQTTPEGDNLIEISPHDPKHGFRISTYRDTER